MADEHVETIPGTEGEPQAPLATTSPDQQATSAVDIQALANALRPIIEETVDRKTQSTKDKRIAGLLGDSDEFKTRLARLEELTAKGLSRDDALWRMQVDDAIAANRPAPQTNVPAGTQVQETSVNDVVEAVLKASGLDSKSSEVTDVLRSTSDPMEQISKFAALAARRKQQATQTPPATLMQTSPGIGNISPGVEELNNKLKQLHKNPDANWAEIKKTTVELEKLLK